MVFYKNKNGSKNSFKNNIQNNVKNSIKDNIKENTQDNQYNKKLQRKSKDSNEIEITLKLSTIEKIECLKQIILKLKKILYVYEKSLEPDSEYNYKVYCSGLAIYISSCNTLFNGELVNLIINLNAILRNDFDKKELKRLVFESINFATYLLYTYKGLPGWAEKVKKGGFNDELNEQLFELQEDINAFN